MKLMNRVTRSAVLAGAALLVTGALIQPALALNFQQDDLVVAIYNGSKEAVINLSDLTPVGGSGPAGSMDSIISSAPPLHFNLSQFLSAPGVNENPSLTSFTVMGFRQNPITFETLYHAGTQHAPGFEASNPTAYVVALNGYSGGVSDLNTPNSFGVNGAIIDKGTTNSFTGRMGNASLLAGGFSPPQVMAAGLGNLLNIISGDPDLGGPVTLFGQAQLFANGDFVIGGNLAPVPLPAAAVLFASGLIGLVGIARRKLGQLV